MNTQIKRRTLLKSCLAAGVVSAVPGFAFAAPASAGQHTQTRLLLGTMVSITVSHNDAAFADAAITKAFAEVERLEKVFNRYDAASALGQLNTAGVLKDAPQELCALVNDSVNLARNLNGAFDISVAPLLNLMDSGVTADSKLYAEARELVDIKAVKVKGSTIQLEKSGMQLTLDGIAKGGIADSAATTLISAGATNFIINAGGDIFAAGHKANGKAWTVAVESPAKDGNYPAIRTLSGAGMATSGIYEKSYAGRMNHLIQPANGISQQSFASVTVVAPTVKIADAFATALATMPAAEAMRTVNNTAACEALFITTNGKQLKSNGWV